MEECEVFMLCIVTGVYMLIFL